MHVLTCWCPPASSQAAGRLVEQPRTSPAGAAPWPSPLTGPAWCAYRAATTRDWSSMAAKDRVCVLQRRRSVECMQHLVTSGVLLRMPSRSAGRESCNIPPSYSTLDKVQMMNGCSRFQFLHVFFTFHAVAAGTPGISFRLPVPNLDPCWKRQRWSVRHM